MIVMIPPTQIPLIILSVLNRIVSVGGSNQDPNIRDAAQDAEIPAEGDRRRETVLRGESTRLLEREDADLVTCISVICMPTDRGEEEEKGALCITVALCLSNNHNLATNIKCLKFKYISKQ